MSTAAEVVAGQADLLYQMTDHRSARGGVRKHSPLYDYMLRMGEKNTGDEQTAEFYAYVLRRTLPVARAYRVQENMTEAIDRRADELDDEVIEDMLPSALYGIAHLAEPLRFSNVFGHDQAAHWVTWATTFPESAHGRLVTVALWNDLDIEPDDQIRATWREVEGGSERVHREMMGRWSLITVGAIARQTNVAEPTVTDPEYGHLRASRRILALWSLLDETVPGSPVEAADEHLPRTAARRAKRDGVTEPAVTTVVLRRESRPTINPGSGTPMTSRVWIPEYTAWRWIGPRHDRRRVRRRIAGHWSNNDTALPVRERRVVSELRR